MSVAVYAAGWVLWPLAFRALAARMLGVFVSRFRGVLAGLGGVVVGGFVSRAFPPSQGAVQNFVAYLLSALLATLACLAALDFIARPATLGQLERSVAGALPRPLQAMRRRLEHTSRYLGVLRIAMRHRLLSRLAAKGVVATDAEESLGHDLNHALQEAGGIFIKLGQVLSTRNDMLAPAVTAQLTELQDHVDPVSANAVSSVIEAELGKPLGELFVRFDETPLAAASIGQVHRARLHDGTEVVIKVQRPDVDELVRRDLEIIREFAGQLETATTWGREAGVHALASGFAENLQQELDYRIEAANTRVIGRSLRQNDRLRVPSVHEELCRRRVLVLEWLDGVSLHDAGPTVRALGLDRRAMARDLLAGFLEQVLQIGVFNADPHPGNILVLRDGQLAQIDFGSVGRLHSTQRISLAGLLIAIERDDPQLLADALLELAAAAHPVDLDALERALAQFLAQHMGPGTTPGADMFSSLLTLLSGFGLAFDPQLAGLFRALVTVDGTLRTLDPSFELVPEIKRLSGQAGRSLFGPDALTNTVLGDLTKLAPILRALPRKAHHIATAMERNEWGANIRLLADERDVRIITRIADRATLAFLSAAIGVISALLLGVNGGVSVAHGVRLAQVVGYIGLTVATIIGLRVLVAVTRDRTV